MPDSVPLPVCSPPPPPPRSVAPPGALAPVAVKTQEDLNVEVYESVFKKCMGAAARIIIARHGNSDNDASRLNQVAIAAAIFDRFYNDQSAQKAGAIQAKAMIEGMNSVLEGRR